MPEPLGGFLDSLRCELVPRCQARSHVTVLPPRPLAAGLPDKAWHDLQDFLDDFPPFRVELNSVEVFTSTSVIYISIGAGYRHLRQMHEALNRGPLRFVEPFEYHPHVTLAQDLLPEQVEALATLAQKRWREFPHAHSFVVDRLTFVQNTMENRWTDLAGRDLTMRVAS
ncbi:MAG TPA: 2'-5' RNA ligase family protein [Bryobacteraceae bacterium]|nr:2'-5' RNA ligase family protein [Bryobacteraceae bacterium]